MMLITSDMVQFARSETDMATAKLRRAEELARRVRDEWDRLNYSRKSRIGKLLGVLLEDYNLQCEYFQDLVSQLAHTQVRAMVGNATALKDIAKKRAAATAATSWVYFIKSYGLVKIGRAKSPAKRLENMQVGSSQRLKLLAMFPGGVKEEGELHKMFARHWVHGEWYRFSSEIQIYLAEKQNAREAIQPQIAC